MPRYIPIDAGFSFDCVRSDLLKVHWEVNGLTAEFALPDDESQAIRVTFEKSTIIRILDEMPLSTEDDAASVEGLVPNHFAYRVEGATFAATQSQAWQEAVGPVRHYEFVTGWGCMDVLSGGEPTFAVVNRQG